MQRLIRAIFALGCALLAVGCDQQGRPIQEFGLEKLARGVSSESFVRLVMGKPDTVWVEVYGSRRLEYPKGPAGHRTWFFDIGKDGKLVDYRQVLSEENFGHIQAGMSRDQVRRLLGRPLSIVQFKRKNEEVWDWRYMDPSMTPRLFNVHFDIDSGKVVRVSGSPDPQHSS
jgi:outer membrane protein assembly factor BamE (lipoprotein component of BamABCDE complex)